MAIIRFFASARDRAGVDRVEVTIASPTSLQAALEAAAGKLAIAVSTISGGSLLYAINQRMAGLDSMVEDKDEVAVLPPMSGGL